MKCELCHENEATVYIQRNVNGVVSERRLCAACAQREMEEGGSALEHLVGPMFSQSVPAGIFHVLGGIPSFGAGTSPSGPTRACPTCGTSYEAFRKTGLVGCASCYEAFADRMEQIFARVQASGRHTGRRYTHGAAPACPAPCAAAPAAGTAGSPADDLRARLRQAIDKEDYEEAARLRDLIRGSEAKGPAAGKGEDS